MSLPHFIHIRGAREHNLKNVSLSVPKNKITVITGLSGSGKSSLAFDTIYAEGQRRYLDSLSSYARHFIDQMKRPDVDAIIGLSPAIAIDQKTISNSPRSTVGTVTEVYDFLRLLFAKVGRPVCPTHKIPVEGQLPDEIVARIMALKNGSKIIISARVVRDKKGEFGKEFQKWARMGLVSAVIDGKAATIKENMKLAKTKRHTIDLVIDRLIVDNKYKLRINEAVNKAVTLSEGYLAVDVVGASSEKIDRLLFSTHYACPKCGYSFPEIDPLLFSFNNPKGACPTCNGLGTIDIEEYEEERLERGDEIVRRKETKWRVKGEKLNDDEDSAEPIVLRQCSDCGGSGLRQDALNVLLNNANIVDLAQKPISDLVAFLENLNLSGIDKNISEKILSELVYRLNYLVIAGAGYLSLNRRSMTLSGGEAQRIRLASQVGTPLVGVLYVLDEPSIGLHPRDHKNILRLLNEIKGRGNTVIVVEHDEETILSADFVVDVGPGAGVKGGAIIAAGTPQEIKDSPHSLTGKYLSHAISFPYPTSRRQGFEHSLEIKKAHGNNLKNVSTSIPLGSFTAVTGISGSGKSTLIMDTLYPYVAAAKNETSLDNYSVEKISGHEHLDRVLAINQKPIGRTPRSCPATYVGLFPLIRDLFANLPEARMRGYRPGHFSFNVKGGRCESCQGAGYIRTSMSFLADSLVDCEVCGGRRYSQETLLIRYKEKSIADVLAMSVGEALPFFENHSGIARKLKFLSDVGLDYISLGQSSTTLSGGEAQRIKLSRELSKQSSLRTLYILDEPTTGLHMHDTAKLVQILQLLVDKGNTVVVIEHNLDLIYCADYILDLGPEGGSGGGLIVAEGTPEEIIRNPKSVTGVYLKDYVKKNKSAKVRAESSVHA
ncbi:MAG: excinuclease ABC subunit UvrA [Bdellovibrionaceae bacterium]|nr:excinuclease ABC subunit UvrA [Pseudobdellovibrionaceae bacterium]